MAAVEPIQQDGRRIDWRAFRRDLPKYFKIRPDSGHFWLDVVFLFCIAALQLAVVPDFTGPYLRLDFLTPWLVVFFVRQSVPHALALALLAGIVLEGHSAYPSGFYLSTYWVVAVAIYALRDNISYRHIAPWAVTFLVAEVWVVFFESLIIFVSKNPQIIDFTYCASECVKIATSVAFGMILCQPWVKPLQQERIGR